MNPISRAQDLLNQHDNGTHISNVEAMEVVRQLLVHVALHTGHKDRNADGRVYHIPLLKVLEGGKE